MHSSTLILVALALMSVTTVDATFGLAGGAIGSVVALAVLKGLALAGFSITAGPVAGPASKLLLGKRSVDDVIAEQENEKVILSTVETLDPKGCILKLICHLQFKEESLRTREENTIAKMFSNKTHNFGSISAPFVFASEIGKKNTNPAVCDSYFNRCTLTKDQVSELLQEVWGCGV